MRLRRMLCAAWVLLDVSAGFTFGSTIQAHASVNLVQNDSDSNSDNPDQQFVAAQATGSGIAAYGSASQRPSLSVFASSVGQSLTGQANGNSSFHSTFRLSPETTLSDAPVVLSFNFDLNGRLAVTPGDPRQGFSTATSEVYLTTTAFSGVSLVNVSGSLALVAGAATGGTYMNTLVNTGIFSGDMGGAASHSFSLPIVLTPIYNTGTLDLFLNCTAVSSPTSTASCNFSQALSLNSITVQQTGFAVSDFSVSFDRGSSIPISVSQASDLPAAPVPEPQTLIPVSLGSLLLTVVQRRRTGCRIG